MVAAYSDTFELYSEYGQLTKNIRINDTGIAWPGLVNSSFKRPTYADDPSKVQYLDVTNGIDYD